MSTSLTHARRQSLPAEPACILRWVFQRGPETLTCAVEATGNRRSFDVCILPHGNLAGATVEHFQAASSALRRHAEIASRLRQIGWVARYGLHRASIAA